MGHDVDAHMLECLEGDAAGDAEWRGEPSGKMATAGNVVLVVVFHACWEISMSRTWRMPETSVVLRSGVGVFDKGGNRCTAGMPINEPRDEMRMIGFFSLGCRLVTSRSTAFQESL